MIGLELGLRVRIRARLVGQVGLGLRLVLGLRLGFRVRVSESCDNASVVLTLFTELISLQPPASILQA